MTVMNPGTVPLDIQNKWCRKLEAHLENDVPREAWSVDATLTGFEPDDDQDEMLVLTMSVSDWKDIMGAVAYLIREKKAQNEGRDFDQPSEGPTDDIRRIHNVIERAIYYNYGTATFDIKKESREGTCNVQMFTITVNLEEGEVDLDTIDYEDD